MQRIGLTDCRFRGSTRSPWWPSSFAYFFEFADINTFATTVPKLVKLWGVTVNQIAYVTSLSFVGMFFGSFIGGWIADRWGRKNALTITTLWFAVFSFASVFSWDIVSLGVLRVLTSAGLSAMTVVAVIYVNEIFPAAVRGKYQAYAIVIGICGTPVTNLIASVVVPLNDWSWRLVYLWGSLGILFLLFARHLKESPRWYESKGQYDKADAVLNDIEARVAAEKGPLPAPAAPVAVAPSSQGSAASSCCRRSTSFPTLLLSVLWVTQTIGFFGYSSWAPTLLAQEGMSVEKSIFFVALTTVGAPLGCFLAAQVTDRVRTQMVPGRVRRGHRAQRPVLRTDVQPDHDRGVRIPGELLRARATPRWPTPTPRRCSTPGPGRWAPRSPMGWDVCRTPSDRSSSPRCTPAPATKASSSSSPAPGCSARSLWPCSDPEPARPGS